jgi:transcriptional regulator with XRE-family HTH domain
VAELRADRRFSFLLRAYRERSGQSRNVLAHLVGADPSYVTRIEHGDREPPRAHIVDALARGLKLNPYEAAQFRVAAGFAPCPVEARGWHPALQYVLAVLDDPLVPPSEREEFAEMVQRLSDQYRRR